VAGVTGRRSALLSATVVLALVAACIAALVVAVVKPAEAAFPGRNGKIVFSSFRGGNAELYSMNPNGSGVQRLTVDPQYDFSPAWSADGTRIAFTGGGGDIYSMNAAGGNRTQLTNSADIERSPTWSPDGSRIAYDRDLPAGEGQVLTQIYLMDADGSDQVPLLVDDSASQYQPAWSPDGSKIAFVRSGVGGTHIYTVNVDGTGLTRLTGGASGGDPAWSPDGSKILFARLGPCSSSPCEPAANQYDVFVIDADGDGASKRLTNNLADDHRPAWSPDGTRIVFTSARRLRPGQAAQGEHPHHKGGEECQHRRRGAAGICLGRGARPGARLAALRRNPSERLRVHDRAGTA
jgi:Tol biopolymer transport system component